MSKGSGVVKLATVMLPGSDKQDMHEGFKTMKENVQRASWIDVIAGATYFFVWGVVLVAREIPHDWVVPGLTHTSSFIEIGLLLLLSAGVGTGWLHGFPRWTYLYLPSSFVLATYLYNASTPGLQILGYPIFGRELWGWRAWVPLTIAALLALLISRSVRSPASIIGRIRRDSNLVTFSLFGLMPLLFLIFFDGMDRLISLYFVVAFAITSITASCFYLRFPLSRKGTFPLLAGVLLSILILVTGPMVYWRPRGGTDPVPSMTIGFILVIVMLLPMLLQLLKASRKEMAA